jgi:predicted PurR-regulated permease PerM
MPINPKLLSSFMWLALTAAAVWLLSVLAPVLTPFILAAVLAYALHPGVVWMAKFRIPEWLGAGIVLVVLLVVASALLLLVVPVVTKQLPLLRDQIPAMLVQFNNWATPLAARFGLDLNIDVEMVRQSLRTLLAGHGSDVLQTLATSLRIGGSALMAVLGNVVLTPIVAYYLLIDYERVLTKAVRAVPARWRGTVGSFFTDVDHMLGQYLHGQVLVMLILAVFYVIALAFVGLKLALPIGLFTGLAVFVPYLGFGLGLVLALLAAALQFQDVSGVLWVAGVYGVGQMAESLWLTPRLLGERIGLHPIMVIFALMAFGHLFGFVGVLIALPASAVLLVAFGRLRTTYLTSDLYRAP